MHSASTIPDPAAQRALLIARTEQRRARMEQLAEVGMALAKEIAVRFIDGPYHPEPRLDPGKSYATVARSIRLTTVLEAKADERILALCEGKAPIAELVFEPVVALAAKPWFADCAQGRSRPADSSLNDSERRLDALDSERECSVDVERPDVPDIGRAKSVAPRLAADDRASDEADPQSGIVAAPRDRAEGEGRVPHFESGETSGVDPPPLE